MISYYFVFATSCVVALKLSCMNLPTFRPRFTLAVHAFLKRVRTWIYSMHACVYVTLCCVYVHCVCMRVLCTVCMYAWCVLYVLLYCTSYTCACMYVSECVQVCRYVRTDVYIRMHGCMLQEQPPRHGSCSSKNKPAVRGMERVRSREGKEKRETENKVQR